MRFEPIFGCEQSGQFQEFWLSVNVTLIHKDDYSCNSEKYCPISITQILSKLCSPGGSKWIIGVG